MQIIYESRKFSKYEEECIWNPGEYTEIDEEYFDLMVVKHREQWDIKYCGNYQEFINKETGWKIRRYYA